MAIFTTVLFSDGFEGTTLVPPWDAAGNDPYGPPNSATLVLQNLYVRSGAQAIRITTAGANYNDNARVTKLGFSNPDSYMQFALRILNSPAMQYGDHIWLAIIWGPNAYAGYKLYFGIYRDGATASTRWVLYYGTGFDTVTQQPTGGQVISSSPVTLDTNWHLIEVHVNTSAASGIAEAWVDNVLVCQSPIYDSSVQGNAVTFMVGVANMSGAPVSVWDVAIDDVTIANTRIGTGGGTTGSLVLSATAGGTPVNATFTVGGQTQSGTSASFTLPAGTYTATAVYSGTTLTSTPLTVVAGGTTTYNFSFAAPPQGNVLFFDDFETGNTSKWELWIGNTAPFGTVTVVTSPVHGGSYAVQLAGPADGSQTSAGLFLESSAMNVPKLDFRYFFRLNSLPTARSLLSNLYGPNWETIPQIALNPVSGGFQFQVSNGYERGAGVYLNSSTVQLVAGKYYCLELQYKPSSGVGVTDGHLELWLDDLSIFSFNGDTGIVRPGMLVIGWGQTPVVAGVQQIMWVDDIVVATDFIGSGQPVTTGTLNLSATSGGTPVSATFTAGGQTKTGTAVSFILPAGSYTPTCTYNGVTLTAPAINVPANGTASYNFEFSGIIEVHAYSDSTPIAAQVTADGKTGTTTIPPTAPLVFAFPPGTYTLTATYLGQSPTPPSASVTLVAGQTTTVNLYFPATKTLTINSSPVTGVPITVDGITFNTNTTATLPVGSHAVSAPATFVSGATTYAFVRWEDGTTNPVRTVNLTGDTTISATYQLVNWNLNVSSTPITGVPITVDGVSYTTNTPVLSLPEGSHTVIVPANFSSGGIAYAFKSWDDGSTGTSRTFTLNSNKSLVATYAAVYFNLTVTSTPITGVQITVDGITYMTNTQAIPLLSGSHSITVPNLVTAGSLYRFQSWENGSALLTRTINLTADATVTATYAQVTHTLTANSTPVQGISITVDGSPYTTNTAAITLTEGIHTVAIQNATIVVGPTTYQFKQWEDGNTSMTRQVNLNANATLTATYVAVMPTLTLVSSPSGAGSLTAVPAGPYNVGQTVVITAVANQGFTWSKWVDEQGGTFSTAAQTSVTMGMTNRTLTAVFTGVTPVLTLGAGLTAIESPPYTFGQIVHVRATVPTGSVLERWILDGSSYDGLDNPVAVTMNTDHTLSAAFAQITHSLNVVVSGATGTWTITVDGVAYTGNVSVTLPEGNHTVVVPTSIGKYNFQKWEDNSTNPTRTLLLTADRTITAFFVEVTRTLTVNTLPAGISPITVDGKAYTGPVALTEGTHLVTVPATASIGTTNYAFKQWEDGSNSASRTFNLTADATLTATYVVVIPTRTLVVISTPVAGVPVTVDGISYVTNTSPITLLEGVHTIVTPQLIIAGPSTYAFTHWDDSSTAPTRTINLTADQTVTATYEKIVPTLTLLKSPADAAATLTATPLPPYDKDQVVVIEATVTDAVNWSFLKWVKEDGSDHSSAVQTSVTMNTNRTLTAVFQQINHPTLTLVSNPAEGGAVVASAPPPYTVNQSLQLTATPTSGNILSGWLRDGVPFDGRDSPLTVTLDQSHTFTANFLPVQQAGFPWWTLAVAVPVAGVAYVVTGPPKKGQAKPTKRAARRKRRRR